MVPRLHAVAETQTFVRDAQDAGVSDEARAAMVDAMAADPKGGDEIRGSGGVRKRRFAGRGKGKSGGYRVLTAYFGEHAPVYALALLSKGERANFTAAEVADLKALTAELSKYWRERRRI